MDNDDAEASSIEKAYLKVQIMVKKLYPLEKREKTAHKGAKHIND